MKDARNAKNWSQSRLAIAMNTREQNVTRWESGLNVPGGNMVAALAHATERPIDYFYVEVDETEDAEYVAVHAKARGILVGASESLVNALYEECAGLRREQTSVRFAGGAST